MQIFIEYRYHGSFENAVFFEINFEGSLVRSSTGAASYCHRTEVNESHTPVFGIQTESKWVTERKGEVNGSTKARCSKPNSVLSFVRKVQSSSKSDSPAGICARETYTSENATIAMRETMSSTTCQEDVTAELNK